MENTAVGPIEISDITIAKNQPLRFTAACIVVPAFDLPAYRDFRVSSRDDEQGRDEICRWLLDTTTLAVTDVLVEQELSFDGKMDIGKGSESWLSAEERVKLLLILDAIALQEGIEIDERDMQERIEHTAEQFGTTVSRLRHKLHRNGGLSRMRSFLRAEKTLDYLLELCT